MDSNNAAATALQAALMAGIDSVFDQLGERSGIWHGVRTEKNSRSGARINTRSTYKTLRFLGCPVNILSAAWLA